MKSIRRWTSWMMVLAIVSSLTLSAGAAETSVAPLAENVTVTNNAGTMHDVVKVVSLSQGDLVSVYAAADAENPIGTGSAAGTEGSYSATIDIPELGDTAGTIYVTITGTGEEESPRTAVSYPAEAQTAAPSADDITVTNKATGISDTLVVTGLTAGDVVRVYASAEAVTPLGTSATVKGLATSVKLAIPQIGVNEGTIYVTVTGTNKNESDRVAKGFLGEPVSTAPLAGEITVTNNPTGTRDLIVVKNLASRDKINVYASEEDQTPIGTSYTSLNTGQAFVKVNQLGADGGTIYVTVTSLEKNESPRTATVFPAEQKSPAPDGDDITVVNNAAGTKDTVTVRGLRPEDKISVYSSSETTGTTLLGASKAYTNGVATVKISQVGSGAGNVYVTLTRTGFLESDCTAVAFDAEPQAQKLSAKDIAVTNNAGGTKDLVVVTDLKRSDCVKVYSDEEVSADHLLGSGRAISSGVATVKISQIGAAAGTIYVTVTPTGFLESEPVAVAFLEEVKSSQLEESDITVTNNAEGTKDIVEVRRLNKGDRIRVYSSSALEADDQLGTAVASNGERTAVVKIRQLGAGGGTIYVTVTGVGQQESDPVAISFEGEVRSGKPTGAGITVTNNAAGIKDTVIVPNLEKGDRIRVYSSGVPMRMTFWVRQRPIPPGLLL